MRDSKIWAVIGIVICLLLYLPSSAPAQGYHLYFLGANVGWSQNELKSALGIRGFLRYSLEAYIPGFQMETSYSTSLFKPLEEDSVFNPDKKEWTIHQLQMHDHQIALSGCFHIKPGGGGVVVYFGGGGNLNFLKVDSSTTVKYWDPEIEDFRELKKEPVDLFKKTVFGYHLIGGLRFLAGNFGSLDIEVRKVFLPTGPEDWKTQGVREKYGEKSWDNLSVNVGFTINIW